ncbi:hypothetical protein MBLNU459_g0637t1 [Dothideomycetes sp. NU459]
MRLPVYPDPVARPLGLGGNIPEEQEEFERSGDVDNDTYETLLLLYSGRRLASELEITGVVDSSAGRLDDEACTEESETKVEFEMLSLLDDTTEEVGTVAGTMIVGGHSTFDETLTTEGEEKVVAVDQAESGGAE